MVLMLKTTCAAVWKNGGVEIIASDEGFSQLREEVDCNDGLYLQAPGARNTEVPMAIDR